VTGDELLDLFLPNEKKRIGWKTSTWVGLVDSMLMACILAGTVLVLTTNYLRNN
jgi:hypothetical protein